MVRPRLHLDADTSNKALYSALLERGHDATRTPNVWMPLDASDGMQLSGATARGRCIFTFSARDFVPLAHSHPHHSGIVISSQNWSLHLLIASLDRTLSETEDSDWPGRLRWLSDWMDWRS